MDSIKERELKIKHESELQALRRAHARETSIEAIKCWCDYKTNSHTARVKPEGWGNEERSEEADARTVAGYQLTERFLSKYGNTPILQALLFHAFHNGGAAENFKAPGDYRLVAELADLGWTMPTYYEASLRRFMKAFRDFVLALKTSLPPIAP